MQFELADHQQDLLAAVDTLLRRHAGPDRCRSLGGASPRYDRELHAAVAGAGFLGIAADPDAGPLDAVLVGEAIARAAGVMSYGAAALVAPGIGIEDVGAPIALTTAGHRGPARFAADAETLLVLDGDVVRVVPIAAGQFAPTPSRFGYPLGHVDAVPDGGRQLDPGSAGRMLAWWRLALAVEIVGTAGAALDLTVQHTIDRHQFGRAIGSFQAVQHRLAELKVLTEGACWLARQAAWQGAAGESAALALVQARTVARRLPGEVHQLTGAVGFAAEYDLHLWTMRLPALVAESAALARPAVPGDRSTRPVGAR